MADSARKIGQVSPGGPILAATQNHIIDAVNRISAKPLTSKQDTRQEFKLTAQGLLLPAVIDELASETEYDIGEVLIITGYLDSEGARNVVDGAVRNFGVTVKKKEAADNVGRGIAVVVEKVDGDLSGSVCISGACLAYINRVSTSLIYDENASQLTGTLLAGTTYFSIGAGTGDADILWEEDKGTGEHWAYVTVPGGNQDGIPAINGSGTEIPPNSVVECTDEDSDGRLEMGKPSADNLFQIYASPDYPVPSGYPFNVKNMADGKVETTGSPAIGDEVGSTENDWTLTKDNTGYKVKSFSGGLAYASFFRGKVFSTTTAVESNTTATDISGTGKTINGTWQEFTAPIPKAQFVKSGLAFATGMAFIGSQCLIINWYSISDSTASNASSIGDMYLQLAYDNNTSDSRTEDHIVRFQSALPPSPILLGNFIQSGFALTISDFDITKSAFTHYRVIVKEQTSSASANLAGTVRGRLLAGSTVSVFQ